MVRVFALVTVAATLAVGLSGLTDSASAATQIVEAESMSLTGGAGQGFSDGAASGGASLLIWSNGEASGSLKIDGQSTIAVRAQGDQCQGAPHMRVKVGAVTALDVDVSATTWTDYKADLSLTAGTYPLSIAYTNDAGASGCDRNLRVDFTRTDSSAPPVAASAFEAESGTLTPGAGQNYADGSASAGSATLVWSNGEVSVNGLTAAAKSITVRASGDQCAGAPQMVVSIDGKPVLTQSVSATTFTDYTANVAVSAANHAFTVAFTNDYSAGCDRNLRVDVIRLSTVSAPTTISTVAPTTSTVAPSTTSTVAPTTTTTKVPTTTSTVAPTTTTKAPTPTTSAPASGSAFEAETLGLTPGAGQTFASNGASAGQALLIWSSGSATASVTTPAAKTVTVRAMGDQCEGAPVMTLRLDGAAVGTVPVPATSFTDYSFPVTLAAGTRTLSISFDNDFQAGCDRNLRLDKITFSNSTPPTTTPTTTPPTGAKWNTYEGFNFQGWQSNSYLGTNPDSSFAGMKSTGANATAIDAIWFQGSGSATDIFRDGNYTPTDEAVLAGIRRSEQAGMQTMLRPMVNTYNNSTWRGNFYPSDVNAWFTSYRSMMNNYATMAQQNGVDVLDIGSEFNSLQRYDAQWRQTIAEARQRFSGKITYSANWDAYKAVPFYDAVDLIGIDAYFPLSTGATPSVAEVAQRWTSFPEGGSNNKTIIADIAGVQSRFNKPVIFTEIGYRSGTNTLTEPWNTGRSYSPEEQQRALQGAFQAWDGKPWFQGMFLWYWNADVNAGGQGDTDHVVQRKPGEQTVRDRFLG